MTTATATAADFGGEPGHKAAALGVARGTTTARSVAAFAAFRGASVAANDAAAGVLD